MPLDGNPAKYAEPLAPVDEDAAVLLRAAQIIERDGWFQCSPGSYSDGDESACLIVAIELAADEFGCVMYRAVNLAGFPDAFRAAQWNNEVGRTAAEVIARLRAAAGQP